MGRWFQWTVHEGLAWVSSEIYLARQKGLCTVVAWLQQSEGLRLWIICIKYPLRLSVVERYQVGSFKRGGCVLRIRVSSMLGVFLCLFYFACSAGVIRFCKVLYFQNIKNPVFAVV